MLITFSRFLHLPSTKRWLLLEAWAWLGLARLAVLTIPFRWILRGLDQKTTTATGVPQPSQQAAIQQVAWAIRVVSRRTPWQSNCLAQALAGQVMLRRRQIAGTLYLGVTKEGSNALAAHAWLRSNEMIVTGGGQLDRYSVVASFSAKPPPAGRPTSAKQVHCVQE